MEGEERERLRPVFSMSLKKCQRQTCDSDLTPIEVRGSQNWTFQLDRIGLDASRETAVVFPWDKALDISHQYYLAAMID